MHKNALFFITQAELKPPNVDRLFCHCAKEALRQHEFELFFHLNKNWAPRDLG